MDIPGVAGAMGDSALRDKADKRAEELLEDLKKAVQAEARDIGTLRKALTITVPAKVIADHLEHNYEELVTDAVVPGFRRGRAPRQLVEKRFGGEVRDSLKSSIIGQSYFAAVENEKLDVLGDPLFSVTSEEGGKLVDINTALTALSLPVDSDFSYTVEVELKPEFELPALDGIPVRSPVVEITDEMVAEQIERLRKIRGRYQPAGDGAAAAADDMLMADVLIESDGNEIKRESNVQLGVRPTRLDGIPLLDLAEKFGGAKVGATVKTEAVFPDDYERTDLRGKNASFTFTVRELKRLEPAAMEAVISQAGAEDEAELRSFIRDDLGAERETLTRRAEREQVLDYLVENVKLELPENLSARQTDRAVMRQVVDLQQRGVPLQDIETKIDELRTSARDQVTRDLKIGFIMEKVAEKLDVDVRDEEVNSEIARIARQYGQRFDRVRDDLHRDGLLYQLAEQIKHDKCVARLLETATIEKVSEPAEKPKKKSTKSTKGGKGESTSEKAGASKKSAGGAGRSAAKKKSTKKKT